MAVPRPCPILLLNLGWESCFTSCLCPWILSLLKSVPRQVGSKVFQSSGLNKACHRFTVSLKRLLVRRAFFAFWDQMWHLFPICIWSSFIGLSIKSLARTDSDSIVRFEEVHLVNSVAFPQFLICSHLPFSLIGLIAFWMGVLNENIATSWKLFVPYFYPYLILGGKLHQGWLFFLPNQCNPLQESKSSKDRKFFPLMVTAILLLTLVHQPSI